MPNMIITKRHDDDITFTDTPSINGIPMQPSDLVGCNVWWLLKDIVGNPPSKQLKQAATITGAATFQYAVVPTDVDTSGKFRQEWELVFPSGKRLTFPNNGYNLVKILDDLG